MALNYNDLPAMIEVLDSQASRLAKIQVSAFETVVGSGFQEQMNRLCEIQARSKWLYLHQRIIRGASYTTALIAIALCVVVLLIASAAYKAFGGDHHLSVYSLCLATGLLAAPTKSMVGDLMVRRVERTDTAFHESSNEFNDIFEFYFAVHTTAGFGRQA